MLVRLAAIDRCRQSASNGVRGRTLHENGTWFVDVNVVLLAFRWLMDQVNTGLQREVSGAVWKVVFAYQNFK